MSYELIRQSQGDLTWSQSSAKLLILTTYLAVLAPRQKHGRVSLCFFSYFLYPKLRTLILEPRRAEKMYLWASTFFDRPRDAYLKPGLKILYWGVSGEAFRSSLDLLGVIMTWHGKTDWDNPSRKIPVRLRALFKHFRRYDEENGICWWAQIRVTNLNGDTSSSSSSSLINQFRVSANWQSF